MYLTLVSSDRMVFTVNSADHSIKSGDRLSLGYQWYQLDVTVSEAAFIENVLYVTFKGDVATVLDLRGVREANLQDYFPSEGSTKEVLEVLYSV